MTEGKRLRYGQQTRAQRLVFHGLTLALSLVLGALWWTEVVEPRVGLGQYGKVIFPVCGAIFAFRLWRELRQAASE